MRVVCNTVEEFLQEVGIHIDLADTEGMNSILQGCLRVTVSYNDVGTGGVKKSVVLQASAVMVLPDGGEYLLETGVGCGVDYMDSTQEFEGTKRAEALKKGIHKFCQSHDLTVRPGLIQI